jgi:hypothetical protein
MPAKQPLVQKQQKQQMEMFPREEAETQHHVLTANQEKELGKALAELLLLHHHRQDGSPEAGKALGGDR